MSGSVRTLRGEMTEFYLVELRWLNSVRMLTLALEDAMLVILILFNHITLKGFWGFGVLGSDPLF